MAALAIEGKFARRHCTCLSYCRVKQIVQTLQLGMAHIATSMTQVCCPMFKPLAYTALRIAAPSLKPLYQHFTSENGLSALTPSQKNFFIAALSPRTRRTSIFHLNSNGKSHRHKKVYSTAPIETQHPSTQISADFSASPSPLRPRRPVHTNLGLAPSRRSCAKATAFPRRANAVAWEREKESVRSLERLVKPERWRAAGWKPSASHLPRSCGTPAEGPARPCLEPRVQSWAERPGVHKTFARGERRGRLHGVVV